ncbi:MAG: butyrate kinase [Elusimicrobium sp.]|uniref:Probable butyrate kinase n=1 Tax=Candidatus Avelusimicrobium gallicola TaxID=2562704 RepID=A0A928DQ68_9BACT|nr:butyrate kinase [Elusimicrobium sp.]
MEYNILVINPGSTSDDIGYYRGSEPVFEVTVRYSITDLEPYEGKNVTEQLPLRRKLILDYLIDHEVSLKEIHAVIGRGGFIHSIEGGVYAVNDKMIADLEKGQYGVHPSNLGGILARDIAQYAGCPSFIANPVVIDELQPIARYSGMPENPRISIFHALSQKRVARLIADKLGKPYEELNCIVCHGGGGITVGAHRKGKVVDVNNGYEGDGPMTPQRSGGTPNTGLVQMCYSGQYTQHDIRLKLRGKGGLVAYTGTSDVKDLEEYIRTGEKRPGSLITCTQEEAKLAEDAMIYQIAKYIGAMAVVLEGKVDFIALTGGLMHSKYIPQEIGRYVGWIAPMYVFPGSEEKEALREAARRALNNPEIIKNYN